MWPYPRLIAHRGGGNAAPENTLAGLRAAAAAGFGGVESDVMLAADGVPVLMHDEELGRTVTGAGPVPAHTSSALAAMDAGRWFGPQFAGEPVPLYREALQFCVSHGLWMNVEIKPARGQEWETGQATARVTRELLGADGAAQVLFSSFSSLALEAALAEAPAIPRGWLIKEVPANWRSQLEQLRATSLHVHYLQLGRQDIARIHQAGFAVFCYTVNSPGAVRGLFAAGVDAVCTDRLDLVAQSR